MELQKQLGSSWATTFFDAVVGPNPFLPAQVSHEWSAFRPGRELAAAVIVAALEDLRRGAVPGVRDTAEQYARQARAWFVAGNLGTMTFDVCCAWLSLNPVWLREQIAKREPAWGYLRDTKPSATVADRGKKTNGEKKNGQGQGQIEAA